MADCERENSVLENEERGVIDYRELIIGMVYNIRDIWILKQIYRCIKNITKEG